MGYGYDSLQVDIYASTQEQIDQIMELIRNTDRVASYDQSIMEIITEETEALFAGQKSAAETEMSFSAGSILCQRAKVEA
jgi:regulatory protein YycI of two-component signal transduction system YycFG